MDWSLFEKSLAVKPAGIRRLPLSLNNLSPIQLLVLGYFLIVLAVTGLLMLPQASAGHQAQSFFDALFVASSGISTTGLAPVDISRDFSLFGQIVLLLDFQVGGIGYMAVVVWLAGFLGRKLSLKSRLVAKESLAGANLGIYGNFFRKVIAFTFFFELAGALILTAYWSRQFPLPRALYFGVFHSVSAFCTAGFSLFSDNLVSFQNSVLVNFVIDIISLAGAIGFFVLVEFAALARDKMTKRRSRKLSAHSRLAVLVTLGVITIGTVTVLISEAWPSGMGFFNRVMSSAFQAISASTTDGFNTMNIGGMAAGSLFIFILLMIIGASPGSTGGGIKTTTLGVIGLATRSGLKGRRDANFLERRITNETIRKSYAILALFLLVIIVDVLVMSQTEKVPFPALIFETASALGNTGLSMGATSSLSWFGKLLLSITMFIGRVGPMTIGLALVAPKKAPVFQYADAEVFIG